MCLDLIVEMKNKSERGRRGRGGGGGLFAGVPKQEQKTQEVGAGGGGGGGGEQTKSAIFLQHKTPANIWLRPVKTALFLTTPVGSDLG